MSGSATAAEVFDALCRQLVADDEVAAVSSAFARLAADRERVQFALDLLSRRGLLPRAGSASCEKDDEACARLRQQAENEIDDGNKLFGALRTLSRAVAHGVAGSESLGKAYLARSDALYELGFFINCQQDLQLASECANANTAEIKSRLGKCESARGAQSERADESVIPRITHAPNSAIACAGDSVAIKKSADCGRHVVATKDIHIGEVIAVEAPFAAIMVADPDVSTTHCHRCLRVNYAPLPCERCTFAMYCSAECKRLSWKSHHQFDCPIAGALQALDLPSLAPFAIRVAIAAAPEYDVIETYSTENDVPEKSYESARYEEIHNLCTNTEGRSVADLFRRAVNAALIYDQFERNTTFFTAANGSGADTNRSAFKGLLLRHMQTAPSNFHQISEKRLSAHGLENSSGAVDIAGGAYSFLSLINHSCAPNVVRHCYGATTVLRAIKFIARGEEVLDNYGIHFAVMPKAERQQHLKAQYLFECKCRACVEDWPLYPDLQVLADQPDVSYDEIAALASADPEGIVELLEAFVAKARALGQAPQPCRNLNAIEECIKECFFRLANTRRVD